MATRNVVLTDTQSDLVDRLVATGRYQNASEALRAGLRLLEREESELGALRDRLSAGVEQASLPKGPARMPCAAPLQRHEPRADVATLATDTTGGNITGRNCTLDR